MSINNLIWMLYLGILLPYSAISQHNVSLDTLNKYKDRRYFDIGTHFFYGVPNIFVNPLSNSWSKNIFSCEDSVAYSYKFKCAYTLEQYNNGKLDGVYNIYHEDSTLVMSGSRKDGKLHGLFKFYCDGLYFPFCDSVSNYPVREMIYYEGKLLLDIKLDSINGNLIDLMRIRSRKYKW